MIGVIILAAGAATRLNRGPKALLEIAGQTLLEIQVNKSGENVIVLTSEVTRPAIEALVKEKGLTHVELVDMPVMPCYNYPEQKRPIGNGALYAAVAKSSAYKRWLEKNISHVSVIAIDNPLADPLDPCMVGGDLVVAAVEKRSPDEKLGSIIQHDNTLRVVEYFEVGQEEKAKNMIGYAGSFVMERNLFDKASNLNLPWHEVERSGVKQGEKFLFDAFPLAQAPKVVTFERDCCFSPIKIESDIAVAEEMVYNHRKSKQG